MTCLENLGQSLLLQFPLEPGSLLFVLFLSSLQEESSMGNQFHSYTSIDHVTWPVTEICTC